MRPTREALIRLAAAAEILDEAGMFADADLVDEFLKNAMSEPDIEKVAGMWANFVSRLGGWARQLLFKEYRDLYRRAKAAQEELQREADAYLRQAQGWVQDARELKKTLKRHQMQEWRQTAGSLLSSMRADIAPVLGPYDEQHGAMIAKVLKIAPQELPQRQPPRPGGEPAAPPAVPEEAAPAVPEEATPAPSAAPAEEVQAPAAPVPEEAPSAPEAPTPPEAAPPVEPPVPETPSEGAPPPAERAPAAPGWRKERFGRTRSRRDPGGYIWEWEVSEDNSRIRLPKRDLADVSQGRGMILRGDEEGKYRTTGPVSRKLKELMGGMYWRAEDDPSDANMAILVRTDEEVPPVLRPPPVGQAERLKGLRGESADRLERIVAIAEIGPEGKTDEQRLADEAARLFGRMESEEEQQ